MNVQRLIRLAAFSLATACLLTACAEPKIVPTSGPHPALAPAQVKIYQTQPLKYEILGTIAVPVTSEMKWDDRGDSTLGFETLKTKAAAQGANGVLLMMDPGTFDISVGAGYQGKYYLVPVKNEPRTALAKAIFVIQEYKP